ncbi:MAG TPA: hypothetical protein DEB39_04565 [Planctomycetaceae bacterium]|nr:hypothetical protein [Planctomycetaceae bacterium]
MISTTDTVAQLRSGDEATMLGVLPGNASGNGADDLLANRLAGMGLLPGVRMVVLRGASGTARPTLLAVGETRIALAREIVNRIAVVPPRTAKSVADRP